MYIIRLVLHRAVSLEVHVNGFQKKKKKKSIFPVFLMFTHHPSVVAALSWHFYILRNKIAENLEIFEELDKIRSRGVLC